MRPSCPNCARKHLAQALVLLQEAAQGYPEHKWLAIGHMAEASDELLQTHPELAARIRTVRKGMEEGRLSDILGLITAVTQAVEGKNVPERLELKVGKTPDTLADGRTVADAVRQFEEARRGHPVERAKPGHQLPATTAAAGCSSCELNRARAEQAFIGPGKAYGARLVILTTFTDFSPSYSLSTVVLEQAHAARMAGLRVHIWVMEGCDVSRMSPLPEGLTVHAVLPAVAWKNDEVDIADADRLAARVRELLAAYGPSTIIAHDIIFQSAFLTFAHAIHQISDTIADARWYHTIHSSVGARPTDQRLRIRCILPPGHRILCVNNADAVHLMTYYGLTPGRTADVVPLLNSRDIRPFLNMPAEAVHLTTLGALHMADIVQVFPFSTPRAEAKGVREVIRLFAHLKGKGAVVRLVLATAHANGEESQGVLRAIRNHATAVGLAPEDLLISAEVLPETAAAGLSSDAIRSLMAVSNVFAFPTVSEAGSLVVMEAALSECLLVLNGSLMSMADYVPRDMALWVDWGSLRVPRIVEPDLDAVADSILQAVHSDRRQRLKRHMLLARCLEQYGSELAVLAGASAP